MTVEEAIMELKRHQVMQRVLPVSTKAAIQMAISSLEKEKEPAPQEAETSSNNNNSISNDNTKLKICQDIIDKQIVELVDYYNNQISDYEKNIFNKGQQYRELFFVKNSLEEIINETEKDH